MVALNGDQVSPYLVDLMGLLVRATPGPLEVRRGDRRRYVLTSEAGRPVATVQREADARVFARDRLDLRALAAAVAEVLHGHRDDGHGVCAQDGQPVPCWTRRVISDEISPRAAAS